MSQFFEHPLTLPILRSDPFSPPAFYAELRAKEPVKRVTLQNGATAWLVARYTDVRAVFKNPDFSSSTSRPGFPEPADDGHKPFLIEMDPPLHTELRRMLKTEFNPGRLQVLRAQIQFEAEQRIAFLREQGNNADLVADYALPIASLTICHLLGVPKSDVAFFQSQVNAATAMENEDKGRAYGEILSYLDVLVRADTATVHEGLIERLLIERVETGQLDREELARLVCMLLMAGFESTATMIALGVVTLFRFPDQLALFKSDAALTNSAVEELLRYHSIADSDAMRVAIANTRIGDQFIADGEGVIPLIWSANRDESHFDRPEELDIRRNNRGQLAFGHGIHQCLGLNLARVEMAIALRELFDQLPSLRLAVAIEELPFRYDSEIFGLRRLPVVW